MFHALPFHQNAGVQEAFKRMQEQHNKDMNDIRSMLMSLQLQPQPQQQEIIKKTIVEEPVFVPDVSTVSSVQASGIGTVEEHEPKHVDIATIVTKVDKKLPKNRPLEKPVVSHVTISFQKSFSKSLADFFVDKVDVEVER